MKSDLDKFCEDLAITADEDQTDYVVIGKFTKNAKPIPIFVAVTEDFNNLTSMSFSVMQGDADTAYSAVTTTREFDAAELVAGEVLEVGHITSCTLERVLLQCNITGTAPTTGQISAFAGETPGKPFEDGTFFAPLNPAGGA